MVKKRICIMHIQRDTQELLLLLVVFNIFSFFFFVCVLMVYLQANPERVCKRKHKISSKIDPAIRSLFPKSKNIAIYKCI